MKVLNLYAGIGGNRKLWENVEVTAVEMNPEIAAIYQDFFPDDTVIVGDAHQYLLDHYKEFDFIWSSPPCPTHSRMSNINSALGRTKYPDMGLYQEIILLKHRFEGLWCVENVISYYDPLIEPKKVGNHYYWANFFIAGIKEDARKIAHFDGVTTETNIKEKSEKYGYDLSKYGISLVRKEMALKNCVEPETGLHILNTAIGAIPPIQEGLFSPHKEDER
jgi:DNA (cytosine-5)-methyltransferase 1